MYNMKQHQKLFKTIIFLDKESNMFLKYCLRKSTMTEMAPVTS